MEETSPAGFAYGKKGLQFTSADGNNFLWFGVRLQTRVANSAIRQDELPGQPVDKNSEIKVNRGRLKLGGHLLTPRFLEFAVRYAYDDIDRDISGDREREYSLAANWFFDGHRNKLTSDISYINRRMAPETDTNVRFRIQWDVSF